MDTSNSKNSFLLVGAIIIGIFALCLFKSIKIISSQSKIQTLDISSDIAISEGNYIKTTVKSSTPKYCEYVHRFARRFPIPIGTDHYYLFMSNDLSHCISIRADKDWESQFQNGIATNKEGVTIEGYVKKLDKDVQLKLDTVKSTYEQNNLSINVNPDLCVDLYAVKYAKRMLISSIISLLVVAWVIFDYKKNGLFYADKDSAGKTTATIAVCILFIAFIVMFSSWEMLYGAF